MKKKIFIIISIAFCIGFCNIKNVFADTMEISCTTTTLNVGDTIECMITGTTAEETRSVLGKIINSNNVTVSNLTIIPNISPYTMGDADQNTNTFACYSSGPVSTGDHDLFSFNVTALSAGTGTISLRNYVVGDNDLLGYTTTDSREIQVAPSDYILTISSGGDPEPPTPKSHDSSLSNLVPEEGELNPGFTSDNFLYSMVLDFTTIRTINFTATKNDPAASVGETSCGLPDSTSVESVICNIQVTAEDNSKSTYKITINNSAYVPTPEPTGDIFINKLTYDVDAVLSPVFQKDIYLYEMSVNFSNIHEINFNVQVDEGITVSGKRCVLPSGASALTTCIINIRKNDKNAVYRINVKNTDSPDIQCDLIIRSNVYTIDQDKRIIKVNSEHSLETIKANLYSNCGAIQVLDDKVIITSGTESREYKLEKYIMPKTGNNKIIYPLAIASVLAIIGIFIFVKKKYFKKEM